MTNNKLPFATIATAVIFTLVLLWRESLVVWYYTLVVAKQGDHAGRSLLWLPSTEGLSSRFLQIESILPHLANYNRTLTIIHMPSTHYREIERVNMCEVFRFPDAISCTSLKVDEVVAARECVSMVPRNKLYNHGVSQAYRPLLGAASKFSWKDTSCAALLGYELPADPVPTKNVILPATFQSHYVKLRDQALAYLFQVGIEEAESWGGVLPSSKVLIAVHWRRGDQLRYRCNGKGGDTSFNCGTVNSLLEFIQSRGHTLPNATIARRALRSSWFRTVQVRRVTSGPSDTGSGGDEEGDGDGAGDREDRGKSSPTRTVVHYVATNDDNDQVYAQLHRLGFHTHRSMPLRLGSLETFVLETQLMASASDFLYDGVSGVHDLVRRVRNATSLL